MLTFDLLAYDSSSLSLLVLASLGENNTRVCSSKPSRSSAQIVPYGRNLTYPRAVIKN